MTISEQDVLRVARLARLQLTADEVTSMTEQLGRIVDYIDRLDSIDTSAVEPMAHAADLSSVFADDQPHTSLDREAALGNAPQRDDECFRVPAVLGEENT